MWYPAHILPSSAPQGGTLRDKLVRGMSHGRRTCPYSDTDALDWLCDTAAALLHLHTSTPPIIHRCATLTPDAMALEDIV